MWRVESSFSTSRTLRNRRGRNRSQRITCSPSPARLDSPRFLDSASTPLILRSIGALDTGSLFVAPAASSAILSSIARTNSRRDRFSSPPFTSPVFEARAGFVWWVGTEKYLVATSVGRGKSKGLLATHGGWPSWLSFSPLVS